ncbi:MAG: S1 family peptidase [Chloroflexi bacterium]|nr:S1 family peptidase [Chloroflexota bacterium]
MMCALKPSEIRSARAARDLASALYLRNPRVTLVDVGLRITEGELTDELAVRLHVSQKPVSFEFESFQDRHPGLVIEKERIPFPVDIVESTYPLQWNGNGQQTVNRSGIFDPLRGGISVSNEWFYNYGTLGGVVKDADTGDEMVLSNWHVLVGSAYAPKGLRIVQPGCGDGGRPANTIAFLERDGMNQGIDAAVARLNSARAWVNDELEIGDVADVAEPAIGMHVIKSGRASAVTEGVIDGLYGEYPIDYGGLSRKIKHVCHIVPATNKREVSRGGDSGSWWLDRDTHQAVALHFAGANDPESALAMDMRHVFEALGVTLIL